MTNTTTPSRVKCHFDLIWNGGDWLGYLCPPTAGRTCVVVNEDKLVVLEFLASLAASKGLHGDDVVIRERDNATVGYWDEPNG